MKPAGLMPKGVGSTTRPSRSIFTRLDAVISSNIAPYGLRNRKMLFRAGTRANVREREIVPAVQRDEPVARREVVRTCRPSGVTRLRTSSASMSAAM